MLKDEFAAWPNTVFAENLWPIEAPTLHRMLKKDSWKLCYHPGQTPQLFNLGNDSQEMHDLFHDPVCEEIRAQLLKDLLADWDHDAIMERRKITTAIEKWTIRWRGQCDTNSPNMSWYNRPPLNRIVSQ